jgi:hypothetical protein
VFSAATCLLPSGRSSAQDPSLELELHRTFGYAGGGEIQGSFLLTAAGPDDLTLVTFYVDDAVLEAVSTPPFQARLHTGDYPVGGHRLWAIGSLEDGSELASNQIVREFVDVSAGWQAAGRIVLPILAIIGLAIAGSLAITALTGRHYRPGVYGSSGGAVCPRCRLPMGRHFLAPNLGLGKKLERCPHCGRWSRVPRATPEELVAAEARLLGEASPEATPEEQGEVLRRQVDDSRYVD